MFIRYLITILPAGEALSHPIAAAAVVRRELPGYTVYIETLGKPGDDAPAQALQIQHGDPSCLSITEGYLIPTAGGSLPHSGIYNQLIIDAATGDIRLHNDTFGLLACYFAQDGSALRVSNSLRLLRRGARLGLDELGVAEMFLFGGWTPTERIIIRDAQRMAAGTQYRFTLGNGRPPAATRLTDTWTTVIDEPVETVVGRICDLWNAALETHFDPIDTPIGLLLSGGLDSRMVAGAAAARGKQLIGLTFGDLRSDEVLIAQQVAAATGAQWIPSGLDERFGFERLAFDRVNCVHETMYNLMWDANAPLLTAEGVRHFSTGATFETIFGGQKDADKRRRLLKNLRQSVLGPWATSPATAAERNEVAEAIRGIGRKRARHYAPLLAEPYRSLITDNLAAAEREVAERVALIADAGPITAAQIRERFDSEHYQTHYSRNQERQLFSHGTVVLPTVDRDLANYLTNLPAGMKYDHALYYRVIRRLYPQLAAIPVPNLGVGVDKSQLQIELVRAWQIQRKRRLTTWVNFSDWMRLGDNMAKYERLFLEQAHFFDGDAVRAFFKDVGDGRRSIYDGGETTGFLNLAYLLDERRLAR
ncbi:MAG: hypothetical protein KA170_01365 [Candidatus Promineofilum sp.]|nr:hypothetical protein [Promineifilum sp.]